MFKIYVGRLTPKYTVGQLRRFFKTFEKDTTFEIVKLGNEKIVIAYGLVTFKSERLARKAIKKLHKARFNGRLVEVREFHYRVGGNDRRALNWRLKSWEGSSRRRKERRQNLKPLEEEGTASKTADQLLNKQN